MSKKQELLPFPLCGGAADMKSGWPVDGDAFATVFCRKRHISDSCASIWVERSDLKTAEKDALEMWNRRV